jgi:GYF domain 2
MSDIWYYALDAKEVGPLTLADLSAILSRASNPKDVLVWRAGFEQWQRAANVPELSAFVIKPPPLPTQPTTSLPSVLPRDRLIAPAGIVQSSGTSRGKTWIAVVVIAIAVARCRRSTFPLQNRFR